MVVQFRSEASNTLPTIQIGGGGGNHVVATSYIEDTFVEEDSTAANNDSDTTFFVQDSGGTDGSGDAARGAVRRNGIIRINLPERPDPVFGDVAKFKLNVLVKTYDLGANVATSIDAHLLTHDTFIVDEVSWDNYVTGIAWGTGGGDYDSSTDFGLGGNGIIGSMKVHNTAVWTTIDLSPICVGDTGGKGTYNWGDSIPLLLRLRSTYDGSGAVNYDANQEYFSTESSIVSNNYRPNAFIYFANPPPEPPFISVIPDEDGIEPKVQVDKHSTTPHILRYSLGWDNVATNIEHGGVGVSMTDSDAVGLGSQPTIWPASKMTSTTLLDTEDSAYSVFIVAEHTHNQDLQGAKSNQVTIARPKVDTTSGTGTHSGVIATGSTVAAIKTVDVGEEIEIRIKSTSAVHSGKIKRFWINWEANISDTAEDYGQFNVDENVDGDTTVTTKNFTHTYDRDEASNFTIKVQVEDEVGCRSNSTLIATITVNTPTPVAKLTARRSQIIEAAKADINNTVVVSGQHSYAQGSNRYIKGYKYKHNGGGGNAPLTAFPTANDNSVIYDSGTSERVSLGSSIDNCNGNTFSYVVCNAATIDAQDTGAYYSLTLVDDHTKIINNHLAVEKDNYKWGGYYGSAAVSCAVTGTNTYDQASGTNYFASVLGLRAGDKVIVTGSPVAANNGTKNVVSVTEDLLVVAETLTDDSAETITFERDTSHIVSVPVAAFGAQTSVITHDVVDDNAQASAATSTQTIHVLSDDTLTYTLTTDVDAGNIAILNTTLSRSGGLSPIMTTGDRRYPLGLTRAKLGLPTLTMNVRIMSNEGLRNMWSLVEGDRFAWVTLKKHLIDAPDPLLPYRTLRLKPTAASLSKTPTDNKDYTASLTFVVMGEDI